MVFNPSRIRKHTQWGKIFFFAIKELLTLLSGLILADLIK
jgi:hypothetical protein